MEELELQDRRDLDLNASNNALLQASAVEELRTEMAIKEREYDITISSLTNQYEGTISQLNSQLEAANVVKDDFETLNEEYLYQVSLLIGKEMI